MNPPTRLRLPVAFALCVCLVAVPDADAGMVELDLVGIDYDTGELYSVSTTDAAVSHIGYTGIAKLGSLEFYRGFLYGATAGASPSLYKIGLDATVVDAIPLSLAIAGEGGLAITPEGTAYGVNAGLAFSPTVFSLNLLDLQSGVTGMYDLDGPLDLNGLIWQPDETPDGGTLIGLEGLLVTGNKVLEIDLATGGNTLIGNTDPLGSIGGMVLVPGSDVAFYTAAGPSASTPGSADLYSISLTTGASTYVGQLHTTDGGDLPLTGKGLGGLAIIPEPASLMLLALGCLPLLRRKRSSCCVS